MSLLRLLVLIVALGAACKAPPRTEARAPEKAAEPLLHITELGTNPEDRRVAVLLHGYGSNEFDLIPLARELGFEGPIESFVGPVEAGSGHAWFPIDFQSTGVRYAPDAADEPLKRLATSLKELRAIHAGHELVVLGFSQGAMMTMMLAAEHPDALDRGVALSGALPRPLKVPSGARHPPVFMAHGTADKVVPVERGRAAHEALRELGVSVTFREYDGMAHRVAPNVVRDARAWLTNR